MRDLPILEKGFPPFQLFPKGIKSFLGRVRGGSVHLLDLKRRPLVAVAPRGDVVVVMSNEVRDLPILERGFSLSNFSSKS